jgi:hypothetical protein
MQIKGKKMEEYLPLIIKGIHQGTVILWKLGLGKLVNFYAPAFGHTMIVSHHDRETGSLLQTSVNYVEDGENIYCTSFFDKDVNWFLNILANPQVEIWLADGWYAGVAEVVEESEQKNTLLRQILSAGGALAALLTGFQPKTLNEEKFNQAAMNYKLVRIRRQSPRTGADGPGSLAWVWPIMLIVFLFRRQRR